MTEIVIKKHYVEFRSPGTLFPETTHKEIEEWDVDKALEILPTITERYNAKPHSFVFITRGRTENDLDSKEIARSHVYFVNCDVLTADEILAGTGPKEEILRWNIRSNNIKRLVRTRNGWLSTMAMGDNDVNIDT